jgi:acyl-CoA thioesterase II
MGDLAKDTAVEGHDGLDGRYRARLLQDWEIWGPNGGYIASVALRAAGAHSRFDRPASLVGHYLGVAGFDDVDIAVTTLRAAKRAESMRVSMSQDGQPIFEALVWAVGDVTGLEHDITTMPDAPAPETLPIVAQKLAENGITPFFPFWNNFEERVSDWIDDQEHWRNRPPGEPVWGHWFRYLPRSTFDDDWVDACRSLILLDTGIWPAACNLHVRSEYMAPSIDISAAFHRFRRDEPWLYAESRSTSASGGIVGGEGRVWSRDGTLLAVGASQLLCRPADPRMMPS